MAGSRTCSGDPVANGLPTPDRDVLAYVVSLVMPTELGFDRTVSFEDVGGSRVLKFLFASLFGLDAPHNLAPSLHVGLSTVLNFSIRLRLQTAKSGLGPMASRYLRYAIAHPAAASPCCDDPLGARHWVPKVGLWQSWSRLT